MQIQKIAVALYQIKTYIPREVRSLSYISFSALQEAFFVVPSTELAVLGIEENIAGEPEEESIVGSNFSLASTIALSEAKNCHQKDWGKHGIAISSHSKVFFSFTRYNQVQNGSKW